jgi:hypothetical protein
MLGHELAIKEGETAVLHTGHQPGHRHFRCICGTRKHAFPEKSLTHCQSVKAADQPPVAPAIHIKRIFGFDAGLPGFIKQCVNRFPFSL